MKNTVWRWTGRIFVLLCIVLFAYQAWFAGHIWWWIDHNPESSAFMETRLETLQEKNPHATLQHRWVPYAKISDNLKRALIAAEDAKFMEHEGFDWEGIAKAYEKNRQKGKIVAGGSTISQQLAKNLFLSTKRSPWRKLEEAMITVMLEVLMDKQRIFEIYLNIIEWGDGVFGAEAAAQHYFQITAAQLTPEQAAQLAAMVPSPRYFDRHREAANLANRAAFILTNMEKADIP